MATIAAQPVHHAQTATRSYEPVAAPEQAVYVSPYAATVKTWTISLFVFGVTLLGSISLWLWYGLHHYQDCL